jgi:hypothetical protein
MKIANAYLILLMSFAAQAAGLWDFSDLAGFEKCMQQDHVFEKNKTQDGSQERFLGKHEIQPHCMDTALKLLAAPANKNQPLEYLKVTRLKSAHENALPFALLYVKSDKAGCEDVDVYETLKEGLSHPANYPTPAKPYFTTAGEMVKVCLANANFKKDIVADIDSGDAYFKKNICTILKQEKVSSSCSK